MIRKISIVLALMLFTLALAACGGGGGSAAPAAAPVAGSTGPIASPVPGSTPVGGGDPASQPTGTAGTAGTSGTAAFSWDAPVTNTDGTVLTDLAGYKLYYGTAPGAYTASVAVGTGTAYVLTGLTPGTYYASVKAVNAAGAESDYSNEVVKTVL